MNNVYTVPEKNSLNKTDKTLNYQIFKYTNHKCSNWGHLKLNILDDAKREFKH